VHADVDDLETDERWDPDDPASDEQPQTLAWAVAERVVHAWTRRWALGGAVGGEGDPVTTHMRRCLVQGHAVNDHDGRRGYYDQHGELYLEWITTMTRLLLREPRPLAEAWTFERVVQAHQQVVEDDAERWRSAWRRGRAWHRDGDDRLLSFLSLHYRLPPEEQR
jgi:hypothetical protein